MQSLGAIFGDLNTENDHTFSIFSKNKKYIITDFQRAYTWGVYQVDALMKDLEYIQETNLSVGLPSVLFQKGESANGNNFLYEVGDGQQRITTVFLTLAAIARVAETKIMREESPSEEYRTFFSGLLYGERPHGKNISYGVLASCWIGDRGYVIEPVLHFQSENVNKMLKDLVFQNDIHELLDKGDRFLANKEDFDISSENTILRNFSYLYSYFNHPDFNLAKLKAFAENVLAKIVLSALIYEKNENMYRSFSNMNSYGIALSPDALVKAELYGVVKSKNKDLAKRIAVYWTEKLERSPWASESTDNNDSAIHVKKHNSQLYYFLEQMVLIHTNWHAFVNRGYGMPDRSTALKDGWVEMMKEIPENDYEKFWEDFLFYLDVYEKIVAKKDFLVGSLEWEINYTYQILTTQNANKVVLPALIMKIIKSFDNDKERVECLSLLRRYSLYTKVVENDFNFHQRIIKKGSPFLKDKLDLEEIERYLERVQVKGRNWDSQENIVLELTRKSFENKYNLLLCELFIFVNNESKKDNKQYTDMFNTRAPHEGVSREHILPQNPRIKKSDEEKIVYNNYIGRLGNSIILSNADNSRANNKEVIEKITVYKKFDSKLGTLWVNNLSKHLEESSQVWGYEEIEKRSKDVAEMIAPYISPKEPFSDFSVLKDHIENNVKVALVPKGSKAKIEAIFIENNYLQVEDGTILRNRRDISNYLNEDKYIGRTSLPIFHEGEKVGEIRWYSEGNAIYVPIEEKNMSLFVSEKFNYIFEGKPKDLFVEYFKKAFEYDKTVTSTLRSHGRKVLKEQELSSPKSRYEKIDENLYIELPISREEALDLIDIISSRIGDTLER